MTVSSTYTDKVYQITGTTTVFAWGQDYDSHYGSLVVTEETAATGGAVVTTYVEGTDYTISNRNVVFNTAPSDTTHYIRITRDTYRGQPVEFHEGEDFPAEDFENALDRLAMAAQEQKKNLEKETAARIAADADLGEAITNEIARAQAAEGNLSNLTTAEKTNLVGAINEVNEDVGSINQTLGTFGDVVTHDADEFATPSDIPTVNNAEIVFTQGGIVKGTIHLNQASDGQIDLDAGGGSSASNLYLTKTVTFAANSSTADIDVSDLVEAGVGYYPVVYFQDADSETLSTRATYIVASKVVRIARDSTATASETYFPTICLIPTTSTASTVVGVTNGQWVDSTYNAYYTKSEADVLLSAKQGTLTFDTTPIQNSQNPVTSGGLYNIIGDVVTLINAL